MKITRRWLLSSLVVATTLLLVACSGVVPYVDAEARRGLAPSGTLRVGVYPGSPTSMIVEAKTGKKIGIAHDLGRELALQLGLPFEVVEFRRVAEVLDALKVGAVDFTFTNATAVRAKDVDFTAPLLQLELGYIVPSGSKIGAISDVDQPGIRVGVSEGSSSQGTLSKQFKSATIIAAPSPQSSA